MIVNKYSEYMYFYSGPITLNPTPNKYSYHLDPLVLDILVSNPPKVVDSFARCFSKNSHSVDTSGSGILHTLDAGGEYQYTVVGIEPSREIVVCSNGD